MNSIQIYIIWEVNSKHRGLDMISKRQSLWYYTKGSYIKLYSSKYSTVKLYGKANVALRFKSQSECKVTQTQML